MRLTGRAFAAAVSPFLFSEIRIVRVDAVWTLRDLDHFEHARYIKKLILNGSDHYQRCNAIISLFSRRTTELTPGW